MTTGFEPLQTHGRTVKTWQPPHGDRFLSYDSRDEAWMRPLGLGRIVDTPEALFDVRDERGELVGYTVHDPRDYERRGAIVCILDPEKPHIQTASIMAYLFLWTDGATRIGWRVRPRDVPDLIRVKWIQVLGEDNKAMPERLNAK